MPEIHRSEARDEIEVGSAIGIEQFVLLATNKCLDQAAHLAKASEHGIDKSTIASGGLIGQCRGRVE